jgi:hypothetical protein
MSLEAQYYSKKFLENFKANTPFMEWWGCACGQPVTKRVGESVEETIGVCDGCSFRWHVMRAAGRLEEFLKAHEALRAKQYEPIEAFKNRPLPARSRKTIQMYNYLGKPRTKK